MEKITLEKKTTKNVKHLLMFFGTLMQICSC